MKGWGWGGVAWVGEVHKTALLNYQSQILHALDKAGQTKFTVYRHRPHEFLDFLKIFQISDTIQ